MRRIYLDAGQATSSSSISEHGIFGELDQLGVEHTLELFDGTHSGRVSLSRRDPRAGARAGRSWRPRLRLAHATTLDPGGRMSAGHDYIVIGAGSAGCAVAARLSEDSNASVLLVEAGGSNSKLEVRAPLAFSKQFHTKLDWDYWTEPEPHLNGRRIYEPRGKMLGGSSSMNAMIYIRGNRLDYDAWAEGGATGWSYDDVLPLFQRAENNEQFEDEFHGRGGPLNVTKVQDVDPVCRAYVEAAAALGIPRNDDFNGARQDGVGQFQVNHRRGMRFSSNEAYLKPARKRSNLTVRTNAHVDEADRRSRPRRRRRVRRCEGQARAGRRGIRGDPLRRRLQHARRCCSIPGSARRTSSARSASSRSDLPAVGEHLMEHPLVYVTHELQPGNVGCSTPRSRSTR